MRNFMQNTKYGMIECIMHGHEGPLILAMHGTPGGAEQIEPYLSDLMATFKCRVLAWSRPGYGQTDISLGRSHEEQALIAKALLDASGETKCIVYAVSGGSPVAYHFAAAYPHNVRGLIAESCVSKSYTMGHRSVLERLMSLSILCFAGEFVNRILAKYFPRLAVRLLLSKEGNLSRVEMQDAILHVLKHKRDRFEKLVLSFSGPNKIKGTKNDLRLLHKHAQYPLHRVLCPVLAIHGTRDSDATIDHADNLINKVKSGELLEIYSGTHILPLANRTIMINNRMIEFIEKCE